MAPQEDHLQSEQDIEEILRIAIAKDHDSTYALRDRLNRTALELGISPEQVADAEEEYRQKRTGLRGQENQELDEDLDGEEEDLREYRKLLKGSWIRHFYTWLVVSVGFMFIVGIASLGVESLIPIVLWGIAVGIHASLAFSPLSKSAEEEFRSWQKKKRRRLKKSSPEPGTRID
ncbi:MAG: 2TM domain-containing protein [Fimbriimonadaceae bacterium]|jgi:hypothetical protein|nr:2TM domain-containing protein [Fimbriimonadaceae bacterium]